MSGIQALAVRQDHVHCVAPVGDDMEGVADLESLSIEDFVSRLLAVHVN